MTTGKSYRTIDARPNAESLVKPGELVDLVEVTPLTLTDRRIYNQLLENAWDVIERPDGMAIPSGQPSICCRLMARKTYKGSCI